MDHPATSRTQRIESDRLAGTFSIVARDPKAKELGIAVQSHYFSVGSAVPWAKYGIGAVATQSFVEPAYGPRSLRLLARGIPPSKALRQLTARDAKREVRQIGVIDARGRAAAWTGTGCIEYAGHVIGKDYSAQGNLLASAQVWPAMGRAFESTRGRLGERLLAALDAGQRAGGDARGMQSACLLIVGPGERGKPWTERKTDLRVEDHRQPIRELRRLLTLQRAYELGDAAEREALEHRSRDAERGYAEAVRMAPGNDELRFWRAAMRMRLGDEEGAIADVRAALKMNPRWRKLLAHLTDEQFPRAEVVIRALRR
jgi:uncharacterized Ntn-hydrolase superfamily protein